LVCNQNLIFFSQKRGLGFDFTFNLISGPPEKVIRLRSGALKFQWNQVSAMHGKRIISELINIYQKVNGDLIKGG
jgi:hypothetical protein